MNKLRLLIVDDEPLAHKILEDYASRIDFLEVVGTCFDSISTINFLNENEVDAILLDIQLPDLTGLELVRTLEKRCPKVIFTTAYTEYALESFNYEQVIDYLHKPIRIDRFLKAVQRLRLQLTLEQNFQEHPTEQQPKVSNSQDFISIKDNKEIHKIKLDDLLYVQAWGNYLKFFQSNEKVLLGRKTIKELNQELPSKEFQRIHKSFMVNKKHVTGIRGNQVILGETALPIGKSYSVLVKRTLL
ncbi:MAG: LytTR family DNA-binding domain-containing protein [Flavobacteriales bacterium]|nr:LytTR family DNA-binding domain-containing protein [Flavobacteriales bacterium]